MCLNPESDRMNCGTWSLLKTVLTAFNKLQVSREAGKTISSVDIRKSEEKCARILNVNCGLLKTVLTAFNKLQVSREAGKTQVSTDTNKLQVSTKAEQVSSVNTRNYAGSGA